MQLLLRHSLRWCVATLFVVAIALGPSVSAANASEGACASGGAAHVQTGAAQVAAMVAKGADPGLVASCQGHCTVLPEAVHVPAPRAGMADMTPGGDVVALEWLAPVETGPPRV